MIGKAGLPEATNGGKGNALIVERLLRRVASVVEGEQMPVMIKAGRA